VVRGGLYLSCSILWVEVRPSAFFFEGLTIVPVGCCVSKLSRVSNVLYISDMRSVLWYRYALGKPGPYVVLYWFLHASHWNSQSGRSFFHGDSGWACGMHLSLCSCHPGSICCTFHSGRLGSFAVVELLFHRTIHSAVLHRFPARCCFHSYSHAGENTSARPLGPTSQLRTGVTAQSPLKELKWTGRMGLRTALRTWLEIPRCFHH